MPLAQWRLGKLHLIGNFGIQIHIHALISGKFVKETLDGFSKINTTYNTNSP